MTIEEKIAVLQAAKEGKTIEMRYRGTDNPWQVDKKPLWDFSAMDYRVKRDPQDYFLLFAKEDGLIHAYRNREYAERMSEGYPGSTIVHVREVLE